jgi:hypothetical protein
VVLILTGNDHRSARLVVGVRPQLFDLADGALAAEDLTKNDMLSVQVRGRNGGDEELTAVGV